MIKGLNIYILIEISINICENQAKVSESNFQKTSIND